MARFSIADFRLRIAPASRAAQRAARPPAPAGSIHNPQSAIRNPRAGFTLLEILIAMGILAVGIIAVMQLFPGAMRQARAAVERTAAANLASSELSRPHALGSLNAFIDWARWKGTSDSLDAVERIYDFYAGWRMSVRSVSGARDLYRVTFAVQMLDGRYETFVTYVTDR